MSCYLCAYQKTDRPQTVHPLPATSPVQPREELGTCWKCSVAACGLHGTRYWQFECAICTPAVATIQAFGAPARGELVPQDGGSPAAVIARLVGQRADAEQRTGVAHALVQIDAHLSGMREWSTADRWAAPGDEPNLVQNFRGIAEAFGVGDFVPEVQTGIEREADAPDFGPGGVSLDAVAAVIRQTFASVSREAIEPPSDDDIATVTGALLLAVATAHRPASDERGSRAMAPGEVVVPYPWEMTHPVLLDPVMWLIATAYRY